MTRNYLQRTVALFASLLIFTVLAVHAQSSGSTRPRRVNRQTARTDNTSTTTDKSSSGLLDVEPANANANSSNNRRRNGAQQSTNADAPLLTPIASTPV